MGENDPLLNNIPLKKAEERSKERIKLISKEKGNIDDNKFKTGS